MKHKEVFIQYINKQTKKAISSILFLFTTLVMAYSQGQINGTIIDGETKETMPFANVALYTNNKLLTGTATSLNGKFDIKTENGSYSIEISVIGFDKKIIKDIVLADNTINLGKIILSPSTQNLNEVLVTAERSSLETKAGKQVLNVGNDIANGGGNITNILKTIPSVEITPKGDLSIRGNENVMVLINGKEVAYGVSSEMLLKQIPASLVEQVEVITNTSAEYDPEFTGGVINVITKKNLDDGITGGVSIEAGMQPFRTSAGLNLGYGKNRFSSYLNYGYYLENHDFEYKANSVFETGLFNNNSQFGKGNVKVSGHMVMLGADYNFNDKSSLNGELMYNIYDENWKLNTNNSYFNELSSNQIRTNNISNDKVNLTNLSLKYKNKITENQNIEGTSQFSIGGLKSNRNINSNRNDLDTEIKDINGNGKFIISDTEIDYSFTFSEQISIKSGLQANILSFNSEQNTQGTTTNAQKYDYSQQKYAFYLNYIHQIGKFSFKLGLRPDLFKSRTNEVGKSELLQNELQLFPSIALQYDIAKDNVYSNIALTYAKRITRPDYEQLDPYEDLSDPFHISKGNPKLKPEYYHSLELLYTYKKGKSSINTNIFGKLTDNVIQEQTIVLEDQKLLTTYLNYSQSTSVGTEINASFKPIKGIDIRPSILYVHHIYAKPKESAQSQTYHKTGYDFNLKLNVNYKINSHHSAQLTGMYYGENKSLYDIKESYYTINLGYNYSLLSGFLNFGLSINDIFNSGGKEHYKSIGNGIKTNSEWLYTNRFVKLSMSLMF